MSGCEKYSGKVLQSQKDFAYLLLPKIANHTGSQITYTTADKAGLLFDDSTLVGSRSLARLGGSASLYIFHTANFFRTMPKTEKVSAGAPGVPDATANARKRVSKPAQAKPIYKVSILSKILHEKFAKSGNVCIFVMRDRCNCINKVHILRFIALSLCPLLLMQLCRSRKLDWGNASFLLPLTYQTFN